MKKTLLISNQEIFFRGQGRGKDILHYTGIKKKALKLLNIKIVLADVY